MSSFDCVKVNVVGISATQVTKIMCCFKLERGMQ